MKKIISILLCITIVAFSFSAGSINAFAKNKTEGDYKYTVLKNKTVKITKYSGDEDVVTIPKAIENKKVTVIGESAFEGSELKNVKLNKNIEKIEQYAFYNCMNMKSVTIPKTVEEIGVAAFGVYFIEDADFYTDNNIEGFYIRGYLNSAAQKYCEGNIDYDYSAIPFIALDFKAPRFNVKGSKGKAYVSYKSVKNANGYQIRYTVNGEARTKTFKGKKSAKRTLKKLTKGKYTVKIRALNVHGEKRIYGKWSKAKSVKVR